MKGLRAWSADRGAVDAVWWRGARDTAIQMSASDSMLILGPGGSGTLTTVVPLDYVLQARATLKLLPPFHPAPGRTGHPRPRGTPPHLGSGDTAAVRPVLPYAPCTLRCLFSLITDAWSRSRLESERRESPCSEPRALDTGYTEDLWVLLSDLHPPLREMSI